MAVKLSTNGYGLHTYRDEELVKLFLETQENRFFQGLYERYSKKVYHRCLSFTKDTGKAEDFTHDIFLKLIFKLSTFKENARFSSWLYSITTNHCMDQLRAGKKRGEVFYDKPIEIRDDTDINNIFVGDDIMGENLKVALDQMTVDEKGLLFMKYIDDLSITDMAVFVKITENAVKMRLLRARNRLRKKYIETCVSGILL